LKPFMILLVDVTVYSHSGYAYMGLLPRRADTGHSPHVRVQASGFRL